MKKSVKVIYYIIVIIIIIMGFVFGLKTEKYSGGYTVYDYTQRPRSNGSYPSKDLGDSTVNKYIGWYGFHYVRNTDYYQGNIKIPKETIKKATSAQQLYAGGDPEFDFHQAYVPEIIVSIIIMIILLIIPFIIDLLLKGKKRVNSNKQFKEVKKLKEKLDLGIISKEEYEIEKNRVLNK